MLPSGPEGPCGLLGLSRILFLGCDERNEVVPADMHPAGKRTEADGAARAVPHTGVQGVLDAASVGVAAGATVPRPRTFATSAPMSRTLAPR